MRMPWNARRLYWGLCVVATLAASATGCTHVTEACTLTLKAVVVPMDTTIAVGQSFRPVVTLLGCQGAVLQDVISFHPLDTTVVAFDSSTQRVSGIAPGQTGVIVSGTRYGSVAQILVTVTP